MVFPTLLLLLALSLSHEAFRSDFPQDIQQRMSEPTESDRRRGVLFGSIFLISLLGTLLYSTWLFLTRYGGSFSQAFAVALTMGIAFALIDLLIVDWLFICTWRAQWIVPPGTEHSSAWRDYGFHLRELLNTKSIIANLTMPLLVAGVAFLVA